MAKQVIFFQGGGGAEDHDADAELVSSLEFNLGSGYAVHYPLLINKDVPDFGRREQIDKEILSCQENAILVGHSLGASMLLAYLSENEIRKKLAGIFLMATPFWGGAEDWVYALKLRSGFEFWLDEKIPLFFYHCSDDKEVPVAQFRIYKERLPWATFREIPVGGHQLNNDLAIVANDIKDIVK